MCTTLAELIIYMKSRYSGKAKESEELGPGEDGRAFSLAKRSINIPDFLEGPKEELLEFAFDWPIEVEGYLEVGCVLVLVDLV